MQVQIKRVVVISAVDETHCRHTITGEVKVRVVGVGKLVEKYVMQNTISALELLDSVVTRYYDVAYLASLRSHTDVLCLYCVMQQTAIT